MLFFTVFAVIVAKKCRLFRFSMYIWLSVTIIGLLWEMTLFSLGLRQYNFLAELELLYHAITEGGPGLIIMIIFADKIGFIDLSEYKEVEKRKS